MKKRIINLLVALTFISVSAFAGISPSISTIDSKSLIVDTKNWKSDFINVEIRDNNGDLMLNKKYTTKKGKLFSFKNFADGTYSIVLSNSFKTTKQFFTLTSRVLSVHNEVETLYSPMIKIEGEHIDLNYLAQKQGASVSIYDENNIVFNMEFDNQASISKRFNINNLPAGTYTFNVSSNNATYSKVFRK